MKIPQKRELPINRSAINHEFCVGGHKGQLNVGLFEDGNPGELFITMEKEGSTINGLLDTIGELTGVALQNGVPIEVLVRKFSGFNYEPSGQTDNPDLPYAKSITDYVFRWLEQQFDTRPKIAGIIEGSNLPLDHQIVNPNCPRCGHQTVVSGTVFKCLNCGETVGSGTN